MRLQFNIVLQNIEALKLLFGSLINPLNVDLNPTCHLLALLAHHILHVSGLRVNCVPVQHFITSRGM